MAPPSKSTKIFYWVFTLLFVLPMIGTAIPELFTASPASLPVLHHLGYPSYLAKIIGLAKLLGAAAVLFNKLPRLKEWAYAGFTFDYLGAIASHLFSGDKREPLMPLAFLFISSVSYILWRRLTSKVNSRDV
ncbi:MULTISPECIES: DoxX family protein [Acidobacteriaceae]|uniref:DoxX family protein n=1 Tax=Acidobacteriaceae TaxID=204434 RepID=UPI00131AF115|nr:MULTISPECIES: DoxX family protein [Acidobacteriaceae]MDW5266121.1 DoxX family protein [Edaphobacter sp.]